jgi:site-specific recombinase XerD
MSDFRSAVAKELGEYLSIRKMTLEPESFRIDLHTLGDFDSFFAECGVTSKSVTEELVSGWIAHLKNKNHSRTISNKVSCLRCFLRFLRYYGIPVFMPQCPKWHEDYVPYIFTDTEMEMIFRHSDAAAFAGGSARRFETTMLIRLLYGCGLRHGEALKLIRSDVDFERGTLLLRQPKNKKQRIVPMHQSLTDILMQYCAALGVFDKPDALLFPGEKPDATASMGDMRTGFRKILKAARIYTPTEKPGQRGQCLHCLRHVFAVKSFAQAEQNGRSTADSVPYLSVYLGHFDMDGTEKYLKFSSDIFPEHTKMFEAYSAGVFSVFGGAE